MTSGALRDGRRRRAGSGSSGDGGRAPALPLLAPDRGREPEAPRDARAPAPLRQGRRRRLRLGKEVADAGYESRRKPVHSRRGGQSRGPFPRALGRPAPTRRCRRRAPGTRGCLVRSRVEQEGPGRGNGREEEGHGLSRGARDRCEARRTPFREGRSEGVWAVLGGQDLLSLEMLAGPLNAPSSSPRGSSTAVWVRRPETGHGGPSLSPLVRQTSDPQFSPLESLVS